MIPQLIPWKRSSVALLFYPVSFAMAIHIAI